MPNRALAIPEHKEIAVIQDFDTIRKLQDTAEIISQFDLTLTERNNLVEKQGFLAIRAGELYAGLEDNPGGERGKDGRYHSLPKETKGTKRQDAEEELGKSRKTIAQWVKMAEIPNAYHRVEKYCEECDEGQEEATLNGLYKAMLGVIADRYTGNAENYTPQDVIDDVREVLGAIDLDPASCEVAQRTVQAASYFTKDDNGLEKKWRGNVFLNPPYNMPLIQQFIDKLIDELPNLRAAILLTNDQTDTKWFHKCAKKASHICLPEGRISFYTVRGARTAPTNGQTFFYFGKDVDKFKTVFTKRGLIVEVVK